MKIVNKINNNCKNILRIQRIDFCYINENQVFGSLALIWYVCNKQFEVSHRKQLNNYKFKHKKHENNVKPIIYICLYSGH